MAAIAVVLAMVLGAYAAGRNVQSSTQAAATAKAPQASVITANVTERVLSQSAVFRGDVGSRAALQISMPELPAGSNPVVTSVNVHQGDSVQNGSLLASIAGRPIIVVEGAIPSYRTMQYGDSGVDVRQLQRALLDLGFGVGSDEAGLFGQGTSQSVGWLYNRLGYSPIAGESISQPSALGQASGTIGSTPTTWSVRMGEIVFVPKLPAKVDALSIKTGQEIGTVASMGNASGAPTNQPVSGSSLLTLGSGSVSVTGSVPLADATSLRPGMEARLDDDLTGGSWRGTIVSVKKESTESGSSDGLPQASVSIEPMQNANMPSSEIGQNIRVTVTEAQTEHKVLVVPISALFSRPDGKTYVRVRDARDERNVPVKVGLNSLGSVEVEPLDAARLHKGDRVIIGTSNTAHS